MISFNNISSNTRVPIVALEFDNSRANSAAGERKLIVIGQRMTVGTVAAHVLTRVVSESQAEEYFGRASQMAEMFRVLKKANKSVDTWAIAVNENAAGVAATGGISITGPATKAGTVYLYINGHRITVGVESGDTAAEIATALIAAINADDTLPVTALVDAVNAYEIDLTCHWKGETGNVPMLLNYYPGEQTPAGLAITLTAMSGGITNPVLTSAIAAMGEVQFQSLLCPYVDATSLTALEAELLDRFGPGRQIEGVAYTGFRGTHGASTTFGATRNSHLVSCIGSTDGAPQAAWMWAAVNAVIAEFNLAIDPARPLQTLPLPGIMPPTDDKVWTVAERNLALFDGISTVTVVAGIVQIDRQITMYQLNASSIADDSYLDVMVVYTLSYLRASTRALISSKFPRHKLANDGTRFGPGQAIVTPSVIRNELLMLFRDWEEAGLVEGFDQYKEDLIVERNADNRNRLDVLSNPDLINQFMIFANKLQFLK